MYITYRNANEQDANLLVGIYNAAFYDGFIRVCLRNSLIRNFGGFCAISASSPLDLALLSLQVSSLN